MDKSEEIYISYLKYIIIYKICWMVYPGIILYCFPYFRLYIEYRLQNYILTFV